jgi:hypothetical protein
MIQQDEGLSSTHKEKKHEAGQRGEDCDNIHKNLCTRPFNMHKIGGPHYVSNFAAAPGLEQCVEKGVGPVKSSFFCSAQTSSKWTHKAI